MSNFTLIPFGNHSIRITDVDGEPWFVLNDVLAAIHTKSPRGQVISAIEQGLGKGVLNYVPLPTRGGMQSTAIVAESAVTFTISRSNTEQARRLNRLLHGKILPEIRKTGGYGCHGLKEEVARLAEQNERLRQAVMESNATWVKIARCRLADLNNGEIARVIECGETSVRRHIAKMREYGLLPSAPAESKAVQREDHPQMALRLLDGGAS